MSNSYVYIFSDESKALVIKAKTPAAGIEKSYSNASNLSLVYYEVFDNLVEAKKRKETIESWPEKKIKFLIDFVNPSWKDWKEEIVN